MLTLNKILLEMNAKMCIAQSPIDSLFVWIRKMLIFGVSRIIVVVLYAKLIFIFNREQFWQIHWIFFDSHSLNAFVAKRRERICETKTI